EESGPGITPVVVQRKFAARIHQQDARQINRRYYQVRKPILCANRVFPWIGRWQQPSTSTITSTSTTTNYVQYMFCVNVDVNVEVDVNVIGFFICSLCPRRCAAHCSPLYLPTFSTIFYMTRCCQRLCQRP